MVQKRIPFSSDQLNEIIKTHPTPFHIYDEQAILDNARRFKAAFAWNEGFKEYFAVKATPNPYIMKILHQEGFGSDCSSLPELLLSEKCGIVGDEIMFSSNDTPVEDYIKARELDATINLDDFSHIDFLEKHAGIPELISFRYNPGKLREGNFIIGDPEESKYGFTREQIFEGFKKIREKGAKRFGVHTFIASNELDPQYFVDTAAMLFDLAISLKNEIDIHLEFINLSGGIGIPYDPKDEAVDLEYVGQGVKKLYEEMIVPNRLHPLKILCLRLST